MFTPNPCGAPGCGRPALSGAGTCAVHHPDSTAFVEAILHDGKREIADLDLVGIAVSDRDLSGIQIAGCRMTGASFSRVSFRGASIQLSFLDRASFIGCDFSKCAFQNAVFAGSHFEDCTFAESDIIQCNFLGIRGVRAGFDHSNLYGSRFIGSWMDAVTMTDCNLTRVHFDERHKAQVDFRSSNTNEAIFVEEEP